LSQTNRKHKNYPRIENCVRRAAKIRSTTVEQQTSLLTTMEFLFLRPANVSSNRNAALHPCSLGPPCTSIIKLYVLSVSEYVTANVAAKPVTFLHKTNRGSTVLSHMCSCKTLTVTRK